MIRPHAWPPRDGAWLVGPGRAGTQFVAPDGSAWARLRVVGVCETLELSVGAPGAGELWNVPLERAPDAALVTPGGDAVVLAEIHPLANDDAIEVLGAPGRLRERHHLRELLAPDEAEEWIAPWRSPWWAGASFALGPDGAAWLHLAWGRTLRIDPVTGAAERSGSCTLFLVADGVGRLLRRTGGRDEPIWERPLAAPPPLAMVVGDGRSVLILDGRECVEQAHAVLLIGPDGETVVDLPLAAVLPRGERLWLVHRSAVPAWWLAGVPVQLNADGEVVLQLSRGALAVSPTSGALRRPA